MILLPNLLTIIRLILSPLLFFVNVRIAIIIFMIAAITDFLDGFIARKYKLETNFGKILDPIADKTLSFCLSLSLTMRGKFPKEVFIALFIRDILLIIGGIYLYIKKILIKPTVIGKIHTAYLFFLFFIILLFDAFEFNVPYFPFYILWITIVSSLLSYKL